MKKFLTSFPRWTFSIVWILVLIWLMAAPTPYMEYVADMVNPYDHLCHILMAAVMTLAICLDVQRKRRWESLPPATILVCLLVGFLITGFFEVLQYWSPEEYRRWFDPSDLAWQGLGASVAACLYAVFQPVWTGEESKRRRGVPRR